MTEKEIYDAIMAACEKYMGMSGARVESYFNLPFPQRLYTLNELLKWHLLREGGDMKEFLRISKELNALEGRQPSKTDHFVIEMVEWLNGSIDALKPLVVTPRKKAVISLMAWGKEFCERMTDVLFKSWLAEGNIDVLCMNRHTTLFIQTDAASQELIAGAETTKKLRDLGLNIQYAIMPDSMLAKVDDVSVYWLVGAAATLGVSFARKNGASLHHACPDSVYSAGYFAELLRLSESHQNILQVSSRTDEGLMRKTLAAYEVNGKITISSADLMAVSMNAMHLSEIHSVINNRPAIEAIPMIHKLIWESEDMVHFASPHLNAIYLSAESIAPLPDRFYHSFDSELDLICKGANYYIPQAEDKLYCAELSNQSRYTVDSRYLHIGDYGKMFWEVISMRDLLKFFDTGQTVAVNRSLRPSASVMPSKQVKQEKELIKGVILSVDPYRGKKIARPRLHDQ